MDKAGKPTKGGRTAKVAPAAEGAAPAAADTRLGKKALLAEVVAATGAKPSAVKPIVEATLTALGQALARGESMVLPPIGRLTVKPAKEGSTSKSMTVKVRPPTPGKAGKAAKGKEALAEDEEDN